MSYEKHSGSFRSANGGDNIVYYVYSPVSEPVAAVQIIHGMCEYLERYEDFIGYLCSNGFLVFGHDQLGHGRSAVNEDYLGYFAKERGWHFLAKDGVKLTRIMEKKYPGLPVYLLGHSMGSLVARTILAKHSDLYAGAVLLGTINTRVGADSGLAAAKIVCRLRGEMCRSKMLADLIFGLNNARIDDPVNDFAWISRDEEVARKYYDDPLCNFRFTASGYCDLLMLVSYTSRRDWAEKVRGALPVLVAAGSDDPIGMYGKGPEEVFDRLSASGQTDLELKIYNGARHEILNETNRAEVYEDILLWLQRIKNY